MEILYFDCLPSTSLEAAKAAKQGAPHLYTVVAGTQSAGRGRLDRSFYSPRGGLYFTTVLRTALTPLEYGAVPLFAAVSIARAIKSVLKITPAVKWVNDLLLNGKKCCGILAESGVDQHAAPYILLGIGINIGEMTFPGGLSDIATSLPQTDRDVLLRAILRELDGVEAAVRAGDWIPAYRALSCVLGREVLLRSASEVRTVRAIDVLQSGALLVENERGEREAVCGGEISLRLTQNEEK